MDISDKSYFPQSSFTVLPAKDVKCLVNECVCPFGVGGQQLAGKCSGRHRSIHWNATTLLQIQLAEENVPISVGDSSSHLQPKQITFTTLSSTVSFLTLLTGNGKFWLVISDPDSGS